MLNCYTDGLYKLCGACALVLDLREKHVNIHLNCGYFDLIQHTLKASFKSVGNHRSTFMFLARILAYQSLTNTE